MKKIVILGAYPPPFGGVSVHNQRLCYALAERSYDVILFRVSKEKTNYSLPFQIRTFSSKFGLFLFALFEKCDVIHDYFAVYNYGIPRGTLLLAFFALGLRLKKCRWVLSCGDGTIPERERRANRLYRLIYTMLFKRADFAIAMNHEILNFFGLLGLQNRSRIIGSFLKPLAEKQISGEIQAFIDRHDYLIISSGFKFESLYNLDMVARAVGRLRKRYRKYCDIGLIILGSVEEDPVGKGKFEEAVNSNLGKENVLVITEGGYSLQVMEKCSLFVRVSNYDGDSVSVREAMLAKIPVVVSDLRNRPQHAVLVPLNRLEDLDDYLYETLEKDFYTTLDESRNHLFQEMEQNFENILAAYEDR